MGKNSLALTRPFEALDPAAGEGRAPNEYDFSPVRTDDLAYALTVFVAAANRKLHSDPHRSQMASRHPLGECERLFQTLSSEDHPEPVPPNRRDNSEMTLRAAFAALWNNYRSEQSRDSICARVLGFYYLMERTAGQVIQPWFELCPERPDTVSVDMVVVESLAKVPLTANGHLSRTMLLKVLAFFEE